ncbi:MAG: class I SAM-dependent methyltransferase [Candidatus Marinimicrobia bacterium]|nr:class I SAM-dependent methyltransferase [Candidatus Neomarinimicrobiota bacterium]MBL7010392.1 class I SAM-dependent methyltransferase [Candidatus Neomarinimicrobiota bacterium]MBL7030847.1 class I SAM-dependent methyltransferase [Candidatus Neomarinimicrobiota bacterium]
MLAKFFVSLLNFSPAIKRATWKWWYQRLAHRGRDTGWSFMNYGFTPLNGSPKLELSPEDEQDRLFIQLYDYAASQTPMEGLSVLEVGSGRGGGASFVTRYHHPSEMTGLDYSQSAIELSRQLHKNVPNLQFIQGDAESLPFEDNTFDAVINVESSHCYGNMGAFVKEVARVLKPGGYFSWVALRERDMLAETKLAFNIPNLTPIHNESITTEVIQALDNIHERKMAMIAENVPKAIQSAFMDFAGVKDSQIYNAFQEGNAIYLARTFQKVTL